MPLGNAYPPPPDYHYLGKLGRTFQLAGGLRFYAAGEPEAQALATLEQVFVEGLGSSRVREVRTHGGDTILYLSRIQTRDQAQRLVNAGVFADPESLPDAPDAAFYLDDLIGLPVVLQRASDPERARDAGNERGERGDGPGADRGDDHGRGAAYGSRAGTSGTEDIGVVSDVLSAAGQDLLVVDGPRGQIMLPLQAPYVELDDERVRVVNPPEGLLG